MNRLKKGRVWALSVLFLALAGWSCPAHADLDVSLVGAVTRPQSAPSSVGFGYGILFDWPLMRDMKTQFGFANLPRSGSSSFQFPIQFKYQLVRSLSFGLGGFYELNGGGGGSSEFAGRGFGAMATIALDLDLMPGLGFLVDLRYLYGPGSSADAALLAGIRLGFGR
jgi:hypothetical protein